MEIVSFAFKQTGVVLSAQVSLLAGGLIMDGTGPENTGPENETFGMKMFGIFKLNLFKNLDGVWSQSIFWSF